MKKRMYLLTALVLLVSSCQKEEETDDFSKYDQTSSIVGIWNQLSQEGNVFHYEKENSRNDVDLNGIEFTENERFTYIYNAETDGINTSPPLYGTWKIEDNVLYTTVGEQTIKQIIVELTDKFLSLQSVESN